jgi:hypothetical protein
MGREMFFPAGIPDRQQKATNGYTCQHNSQDVRQSTMEKTVIIEVLSTDSMKVQSEFDGILN